MNITQNLHKLDMFIEDSKNELQEMHLGTSYATKHLDNYTPPSDEENEQMYD